MSTPDPGTLTWRKSSFTNPNECVELAWPVESTAVRDSKNSAGPMLVFPRAQAMGFLIEVSAGTFDR